MHLAALRRKLGDPALIETVYGHGFRLADRDARRPRRPWPGARKRDRAGPGRPHDRAGRAVTRRIALALVLLTAAVLIAAVVPLALGAIDHERDAFVSTPPRTASSIALLPGKR